MKVQTVDSIQGNLGIEYTTDELVVAIDYWINRELDRPIKGLGVVEPPEVAPAEEKFLGGGEKVVADHEPPVVIDNELIVGDAILANPAPVEPVGQQALDVTEVVVTPPTPKPQVDEGLGVVQFFAIIIFCSIVLYILRKFNELK